jgi:DNA-binding CsgD family transcriptional regulator
MSEVEQEAPGMSQALAPDEEHELGGGDALLAPSVTRRIIEQFARRPLRPEAGARLQSLTQREREVLLMLARGHSKAELAAGLFVSEGPLRTHVRPLSDRPVGDLHSRRDEHLSVPTTNLLRADMRALGFLLTSLALSGAGLTRSETNCRARPRASEL